MYRKLSVSLLVLSALVATLTFLVPLAGAQDANKDVFGRDLPEDAAPYDMQTWSALCDSTRTETSISSVVTVYQRICGDTNFFDLLGDPLVNLDENLNLIPGAAES